MPEDIHQDRFALVAVLTRAHKARPTDYVDSQVLMSMTDERLVEHAAEVLRSLEDGGPDDYTAGEVRTALRQILGEPA
jgi:hypothetical protein